MASGDIFCCLLVISHQKGKKTHHGSCNDDVINFESNDRTGYTFSFNIYVLWPVALKLRILGSFMLLMTNNYKFVSKK